MTPEKAFKMLLIREPFYGLVMSNLQNYPVGDYRLKVWATNMPERGLIGGNLSDANNVDWILYDENIGDDSDEQGNGIFYFSLTD